MTSLAIATVLSLVAGDKPPKNLDIKLDKVDTPSVSMPDLNSGNVPKAEGLKATNDEHKGPQLKQADTETVVRKGDVTVDKVVNASEFQLKGVNQVAKGAISELNLYSLPAKVPAFKTCITFDSPDGVTKPIVAALRSPVGDTLVQSRGEVVFPGPGKMDFVIDWSPFEARMAGNYKITIQLGVQKAQDFVLPVKLAGK